MHEKCKNDIKQPLVELLYLLAIIKLIIGHIDHLEQRQLCIMLSYYHKNSTYLALEYGGDFEP